MLATAASLAITTQIELRTSFKDLLGEQDPVAQQLAYFEDNFPIASTVRVLMEGRDPDRLIAAGAALTERLEAHPDRIRYVAFEQPVDFFVEHSLLYLDVDDLRFAEASLAEQQAPLRALMADPSALGMMGGLDALMAEQARPADTVARINSRVFGELELGDAPESGQAANVGLALNTGSINRQLSEQLIRTIEPLPLPPSREETLQGLRAATELFDMVADVLEQGERVTPEAFSARARALQDQGLAGAGMPLSRYALSPDGTALVIDLFTAEPVLDIEVARPFLAWLEPMVDEVAKLYPDVSLRLTGLPVMFKQENEALLDNFALVTLLGFVGILAVFIIGFERVGLPSLSGIPLVMGATWTFGVITVVNGGLTLFSLTFPVLLFGIGIDFAIHLMSGYSEQRREGLEPEEALNVAFDKIGAGLLTGALTTAMAFLVMMTSAFYGYKDMGFTAGVGVLTALLAMLTVLPAIMVMWDQRQQARGEMLPDVPFPFLEPLGRILVRNRYLVLAAFLVVSLTFGYFAAESRLDQNYLNIIPKDIPAARAQARILEVYGTSNEIVTFFADDLEQAERIRAAAEATPSIAEVMSPSALVPEHQADKEPAITAIGARLAELPPPRRRRPTPTTPTRSPSSGGTWPPSR
ncbi:MAG: MMPL family transporter [Alphaproteobacteria bacterium]|nr:MMPL family transporter [Alphaproteobacteria bacterium]